MAVSAAQAVRSAAQFSNDADSSTDLGARQILSPSPTSNAVA
jgi:hypothetical protein